MARDPSSGPSINPDSTDKSDTSAGPDTPPDDDLASIEPPIEPPPPTKDWNPQRTIDGKELPGAFIRAKDPDCPWDAQSLALALGTVHTGALVQKDTNAKGGYAKLQPVTANNVHAAMAYLGLRVRLNLMDCSLDVVAPERIDYSRFGTLSDSDRNSMLVEAFCDAVTGAGLRDRAGVKKALANLSKADRFHPMRDWIESKPWDGQDRFQALLGTVTTDTPDLLATYFRRWALQTVEAACGWVIRAKAPKSLVLVLAGPQGIGKTRWLMALAPEFSQDGVHLNLNASGSTARDSKHEALRRTICELGELEATFGKSAIELLKGFLAALVDVYRLPYGEQWTERPRTTSFCGSVNDTEFLVDKSGNRRYAAVAVSGCNANHGIDMQQFWAQVHTWWKAGEQWWLTPDEERLQTTSNKNFQQIDGIDESISDAIAARENHDVYTLECPLSQTQVCRLLGLKPDHTGTLARVGVALKKHLGKSRDFRRWGGSQRAWIWWLTTGEAESLDLQPLRPVNE